jgi:subtilisin family serine protease
MTEETKLATRVVIKLTSDHQGTVRSIAQEAPIHPYFSEEKFRTSLPEPFDRYFAIEVRNAEAAATLVRKIAGMDAVEEVYVESGPAQPPVNPSDDPRFPRQGYLGAAPQGIDASWAWTHTNGSGVLIVDLEQGWKLDHEDLAAKNITLISGLNHAYVSHGTSVLGELVASDNTLGGIGIAPAAAARVVSQWRNASTYGTAAAILSAAGVMGKGDVLLLEAQTIDYLPVEVESAVFDAIRYVVDQGIVVIEAGGNGTHDLDSYKDASNRFRLNRNSPDFRDSGAILVGAAESTLPHRRCNFSNYGSRVDCYAWGRNIDTTDGDSTTDYTSGFGGTSGASPMVAGAAALLQSWRKKKSGQVYQPDQLRDMLSSDLLNTPSANPASDRIGVMPDLRGLLQNEMASPFRKMNEKYLNMVYILSGIINDAKGWIFVPGKGPVPVDPGWSTMDGLSTAKRDLLASLAAHELSNFVSNPAIQKTLTDAANNAMRQAVEQIARGTNQL